MKNFKPKMSYLRVATATPEVAIADVSNNFINIKKLYKEATKNDVSLVVYPELSITGYSLGDLVRQANLLNKALITLNDLAILTANQATAMIVGLPVRANGHIYNVAAFLADGEVKGLVPKTNMPNYAEFYEQRWYQPLTADTYVEIGEKAVLLSNNLLFNIAGCLVGVEICEDMWVPNQPSRVLSAKGALIIANPSASPELVGKANYRTELVKMTSAVQRIAYIYSGADWTESTTDIVMGGHAIIAENGSIIAERQPFTKNQGLLIIDIDLDHLLHDRSQDTTTPEEVEKPIIVETSLTRQQTDLKRVVPSSYFLPSSESQQQRKARLNSIFTIQAHGLARRLIAAKSQNIVLGLSGGLDSTLALLVAHRAALILGKNPKTFIHTLTMPGPASSHRTQDNAVKLAKLIGAKSTEISIVELVKAELKALSHSDEQDITYENTQARIRTNLLFNYANKHRGLVLGTGDLSELALGWCTFGGDHLSNYNVNGSIPKTLVRDLVEFASDLPELKMSKIVLNDILNTPISPELTKRLGNKISQNTEDLIGPYELHDFFLYQVLRYGDTPKKIAYLAKKAFGTKYTNAEILKWLNLFYERFANNQFKRSTLPDGPKVGSVAVSPRGDWRMPSDATSALWK